MDKNIWNLFVKEHNKWGNFEDFKKSDSESVESRF